jgi:hypothetical protein
MPNLAIDECLKPPEEEERYSIKFNCGEFASKFPAGHLRHSVWVMEMAFLRAEY